MDGQPCRDDFFRPQFPSHRLDEALLAVVIDGGPEAETAAHFGYKPTAFKVWINRFRHDVCNQNSPSISFPMAGDVCWSGLAARTATDLTRPPSPIGGSST